MGRPNRTTACPSVRGFQIGFWPATVGQAARPTEGIASAKTRWFWCLVLAVSLLIAGIPAVVLVVADPTGAAPTIGGLLLLSLFFAVLSMIVWIASLAAGRPGLNASIGVLLACIWLAALVMASSMSIGPIMAAHLSDSWNNGAWAMEVRFLQPRGASLVIASGIVLLLPSLNESRPRSGVGEAIFGFAAAIVGFWAILSYGDVLCLPGLEISASSPELAARVWLYGEFYGVGALAIALSLVVLLRNVTASLKWIGRGLAAQMHAEGSRRLASVHFWSACTLGIYGGWIAIGRGPRPTDEALRKQGTCCLNWSVMCVLLMLCFFGVVGGFCVAICLLAPALVPPSGIGMALGAYEALVAIAYLWIFIGYSVRAYRRVLAGGEPAYPMARGFRLF